MRAHHIEFCWSPADPRALRAHCTACDEYVGWPDVPDNWESIRRAQARLRAILEERPCHPDRRGAIIVGGGA